MSRGRELDLRDLVANAHALHDRELRVLNTIACRLLTGQHVYGPLSPGKKDWKREAKEEAMDMAVYLSALLEDDVSPT